MVKCLVSVFSIYTLFCVYSFHLCTNVFLLSALRVIRFLNSSVCWNFPTFVSHNLLPSKFVSHVVLSLPTLMLLGHAVWEEQRDLRSRLLAMPGGGTLWF